MKTPEIQNLKQLVDKTTGSESILGTVLNHTQHGRAVLVEIDRRNNGCTLYYEDQKEGYNGFRNVLFDLENYSIESGFSMEKAREAMKLFLS